MPDRLSQTLVGLAMELHARRPWTRVPTDAPFLIRVPGEEFPIVATIMGQARSDYGVMLLRGEDAFLGLVETLEKNLAARSMVELGDIMGVTFEPLSSIPPVVRPVLVQAGFSARRENVAPHIMVKPLGRHGRAPNRREMRTMVFCLRGIIEADKAGDLGPEVPDARRRRVFEIEVIEERDSTGVMTRRSPWPKGNRAARVSGLLGLDSELSTLPRLEGRWIASLSTLPLLVHGDERSAMAFLLVEEATELILATEVIAHDELATVGAKLEQVLRGEGQTGCRGRPTEIAITSPALLDALAPALASIGVPTCLEPEPAIVRELLQSIGEHLHGQREGRDPPPTSLADWKTLDCWGGGKSYR